MIASWELSCPLQCTCAECGLEFDWRDVLSSTQKLPHWCVEYARGVVNLMRRVTLTLQISLWPPRFWRELKMTHPSRWGRLVAFYGILVVGCYAMLVISHALAAASVWRNLQPQLSQGSTTNTNGWEYIANSASRPLSDVSYAQVVNPGGGMSGLPSPRAQFGNWDSFLDVPVALLSFAIACPLVFLALPHSMRRARVRWSHILRIVMYGGCWLVIPVYLIFLTVALERLPDSAITRLMLGPARGVTNLAIAAVIPGLMVWWASAVRHYLRMSEPRKVWLSVVTIALLASLATMYHLTPHRILRVLEIVLYESRMNWPWPV